jgi:hypothetical protein
MILPISASQVVARIAGMSHQCPTKEEVCEIMRIFAQVSLFLSSADILVTSVVATSLLFPPALPPSSVDPGYD